MRLFATLFVLFGLLACNSDSLNFVDGGIDGTGTGKGTNIGPISDFGSIIVNDMTYETDNAEVFINGEASHFEELRLGMQVTVEGTKEGERDIAERIDYQDVLRGNVMFISPQGNSLMAAGQTILIDEKTLLRSFSQIDELRIGDYIRVSGPSAGAKGVKATLIERLLPTDEILLSGMISNLDSDYKTFIIRNNGLLVSYKDTQILPVELYNGLPVEVIGTIVDKTILKAKQIRVLDINQLTRGTAFIFNGSVTRFESIDDFDVEYRTVKITENTHVDNDKLEKMGLGSHVKVEGSVNAEGLLLLDSIEIYTVGGIKKSTTARISGLLENIDLQNHYLTLFGVKVHLLPDTLFRDVTGQFERFRPTDLRLGDKLAVVGTIHTNGDIAAETILYEPFSPTGIRQLQGLPKNIDHLNSTFNIFGVTVLTHAGTEFFDTVDNPPHFPPPGVPLVVPRETRIDNATFFSRINSDILVYVFGEVQGNMLLADEIILVQEYQEAGKGN